MEKKENQDYNYTYSDNEEFSLIEGNVINNMQGCAFLFLGIILAIVTCIVTYILWK
jgi:hypothetical protein